MTADEPAASPAVDARAALADALAAEHEADALARAVYVRLCDDTRNDLAAGYEPARLAPRHLGSIVADALCADGYGERGRAVVDLLRDGGRSKLQTPSGAS